MLSSACIRWQLHHTWCVFCTASQLTLRLEVVVWWTRHRSPIAATLAYVCMLSVRDISAILDKAIID